MTPRVVAPASVVLGAAAAAGGSLPRWWTVHWVHRMLGAQTTEVVGRQAAPSLLVMAAVAIAGIGAVAAAGNVPRRVIGLLLAVVGALMVVVVLSAARSLPGAVITERYPQLERVIGGEPALIGPLISGAGGLLVLAGGLLVLGGNLRGQGMGSRFDRRQPAGPTARPTATELPDSPDDAAAGLWESLDSGTDPTAEPTGEPTVRGGDSAATPSSPAATQSSPPATDPPGGHRPSPTQLR